ncbi:VOC family protein [Gracilibacillus caseinilyticus]|uniref:VOC family protein n=1 Tax=Gracilibacillus caseinilyticus TaxID=2932256 RepID=A0ABY4F0U0_9BACI|nr:VOC family protein [Gracilibacillus caseinilyticus]UOQ50145.1 VOC family protein [Gracilibacillus caseinilyticus]
MVKQRISLITIGAFDLPMLRSFYQKLGWDETSFSSDTYAAFQTAGVMLTLFPVDELAKDAGITLDKAPEKFQGVTFAINVDSAGEVDQTMDAIREAGATILREPSDAFWGGRTAYFADPENNIWEVAWNPSAVFDERGAMITF